MTVDDSNSNNRFAPPRADVADIPTDDGTPAIATRGARFGAALIDTLIAFALYLAVMLPLYGLSGLRSQNNWTGLLIYYGLAFALEGWFLYRSNQTLGKLAMGVRIVRQDGSHASFGRSFWLRTLGAGAVCLVPLVGWLLWIVDSLFIFGAQRRCVHDLLADTIVVTAASSEHAVRSAAA
jgi:uncharacterized RDD family membrane protein YckC